MEWKTGDIAKRIGVHPNTVRTWADQYSQHMSAKAVSSRRRFTEDDLRFLATVAHYRDQGIDPTQITTLLMDRSNLLKELPLIPSPEEEAARESVALVTLPQLERALDQIQQLEVERDRLVSERDRAVEQRETDRKAMTERIEMLTLEIGQLRGQLENRKPADYWLTRLAAAVLVAVVLVVLVAAVVLILTVPS